MIAETVFVITMYGVGCDVKPGHPTKSGVQPALEWTAAADLSILPIGTIVIIEGFGERMVQDKCPACRGKLELDLFVASCDDANLWGRKKRLVKVKHRPKRREP